MMSFAMASRSSAGGSQLRGHVPPLPQAGQAVRVEPHPRHAGGTEAAGQLQHLPEPPRRLAEAGEAHLPPPGQARAHRGRPDLVRARVPGQPQIEASHREVVVADLGAEPAGQRARAGEVQVERVPEQIGEDGSGGGDHGEGVAGSGALDHAAWIRGGAPLLLARRPARARSRRASSSPRSGSSPRARGGCDARQAARHNRHPMHRVRTWQQQREQRIGTLWNGRYRGLLIEDERYWLTCLRYVEQNPVRAGMVEAPGDYAWSSYAAHAFGKWPTWLTPHCIYQSLGRTDSERQRAYRQIPLPDQH